MGRGRDARREQRQRRTEERAAEAAKAAAAERERARRFRCLCPGGQVEVAIESQSCMGDTDAWLQFRAHPGGARLWQLWDPDDYGLAFSSDGRLLYAQKSDHGQLRTTAYELCSGVRLPDEPPPTDPTTVFPLREWQQEKGCLLVGTPRDPARPFHVIDAGLLAVDAAGDTQREALLERLLAAPPTAERWQQLLEVLRTWEGPAATRGFERVRAAASTFPRALRHAPDWLQWAEPHPVWELVAALPRSLRLGPAHRPGQALRHLARSEALGSVRFLTVREGGGADRAAVEALAMSPHAAGLRILTLAGNPVGPLGAAALASSPHLAGLESLNLPGCRLGDLGAAALSGSDQLVGLRLLDLGANGLSDGAARALARWPHLSHLSRLDLPANPLGDAGAFALAASSAFAPLRILDVTDGGLGAEGARALAASPFDRPLFGQPVPAPYLRRIDQSAVDPDVFHRWQLDAAQARAAGLVESVPEHLRVQVLRRHGQLLGDVVLFVCVVLAVERTATDVQPGDTIHVASVRSEWPPHPWIPDTGQTAQIYLRAAACSRSAWDPVGRHLAAQHPATAPEPGPGEHRYYAAAAGRGSFVEIG